MEKIYYRCSTDKQQFLQQQDCVRKYLQGKGIDPDTIEVTEEHISGRTKANDRKLGGLIRRCVKGDVIYVSELSRGTCHYHHIRLPWNNYDCDNFTAK